MRFVENVEKERFDAFMIAHPLNHYSKTSPFIELQKDEYHRGWLLGVEDDNGSLIAGAVMLEKKTAVPFGRFCYCQYGFNLDIGNRELISFFARNLKEFAKKQGAFLLRMDFNITRLEHEKDGTLKMGGFNHEYVTQLLCDEGFTHLGYNYGYSGNWMSRYTYRLDLDRPLKDILKGIKRCSTYANKNEERCVRVRPGTIEELGILVDSEQELSEKLGFKPKDTAWFRKLWRTYAPYVHYYIVETNYHQAKLNLMQKIAENEKKLAVMKDEKKMDPLIKSNAAMQKEIREIEEGGYDRDETVPLGAKFIIMMGPNVWNVNMYTTKTLMNFRGAFALHRYAIEDVWKLGAKTYDFEGISGSLDPNDEYYGQQDFKKSFGGDFLEFLGEFDAVLNRPMYLAWLKSDRLYRRVRRKVRYIFNKK